MTEIEQIKHQAFNELDKIREDQGNKLIDTLNKISGLERSNYGKYKNGDIFPELTTIWKLAQALGYRVKLTFEKK